MGKNAPEYQAEYRARNPEYVIIQGKRQMARTRAMRRLREKYPDVFAEFFRQELAKYNLKP